MTNRTFILNHKQVMQKTLRIAYQIAENNTDSAEILIGGVSERGGIVAELIVRHLKQVGQLNVIDFKVQINRNDLSESQIKFSIPESEFKGRNVVLVDDVLNTGNTLIHILLPLVKFGITKAEVAVLADRNHKMYPVLADFVGISLATTRQEHIYFDATNPEDMKVYLA